MLSHKKHATHEQAESEKLTVHFRDYQEAIPKYVLSKKGLPPNVAYRVIHNELSLDGNPLLNLASFVSTWMEPDAHKLITENINKNYADFDEYPQTLEIQHRCVNMLAHLFHSPEGSHTIGTSTIGSSEANMLAGLALKRKWKNSRESQHQPTDKPNIIMSTSVQVAWKKFACYFEVEIKEVPVKNHSCCLDIDKALSLIDENTIAVVAVLGNTLTGECDEVDKLNDALLSFNAAHGLNVPIHVDAASGGFVVPFLYPEFEWDFRLPLVKSINVSGHKYGLVFPGVGWAIWKTKDDIPEELFFNINYLGSNETTFTFNFSRNAVQIIAQYYNFLRLGFDGYKDIMKNLMCIADYVSQALLLTKRFELVRDQTKKMIPVVCVKLTEGSVFSVYDLSHRLRTFGWIVPAYSLSKDLEETHVMRVVIRDSFNLDMAHMLLNNIETICTDLEKEYALTHKASSYPKQKKHHDLC